MNLGTIGILLAPRNCPALDKRLSELAKGSKLEALSATDLVWQAGQVTWELERDGFTPIMGAEAIFQDYHRGARGMTYLLRYRGPSWELVSVGQVEPIPIPTKYRADSSSKWGAL